MLNCWANHTPNHLKLVVQSVWCMLITIDNHGMEQFYKINLSRLFFFFPSFNSYTEHKQTIIQSHRTMSILSYSHLYFLHERIGDNHLSSNREKEKHRKNRLRNHFQELLVETIHIVELRFVFRKAEAPKKLHQNQRLISKHMTIKTEDVSGWKDQNLDIVQQKHGLKKIGLAKSLRMIFRISINSWILHFFEKLNPTPNRFHGKKGSWERNFRE